MKNGRKADSDPSFGVLSRTLYLPPLEFTNSMFVMKWLEGILLLDHVIVRVVPSVHVSPPFGERTVMEGVEVTVTVTDLLVEPPGLLQTTVNVVVV